MRRRGGILSRAARAAIAVATLSLLAACAGPALDPANVEHARAAYQAAQDTEGMRNYAASSMGQARHHLQRAEALLRDDGDQDAVDHHAFLARQHLAIAEARLRRGLAQAEIEQFESRRQALVSKARQRDAALAAERAQAVEDELTDTRMQLRMAEQRARALAERLVELGVTESRPGD